LLLLQTMKKVVGPCTILILISLAACGRKDSYGQSGSAPKESIPSSEVTVPSPTFPEAISIPPEMTNPKGQSPIYGNSKNKDMPADLQVLSQVGKSNLEFFDSPYQPPGAVKPLEPNVVLKQTAKLGNLNDYNHLWVNIFPNLSGIKETEKIYPAAKDPRKFELSSSDPLELIRLSDNQILATGHNITFDLSDNSVGVGGVMKIDRASLPFDDVLVRVPAVDRTTSIKACWNRRLILGAKCYSYRGIFKISKRQRPNGNDFVNAVNIVEIKDYLRGVIKNEIGSDRKAMTALQAQSIAAETYALFGKIMARYTKFFENNGYEIFSTEESQVYIGTKSETPETNYAVESTFGKLILYQGKIIHAEYHACAGGKTETVPGVPYLVAKNDPGTKALARHGHGRGLSQMGAVYFSKQFQWSAEDILKYYYTGVTVSRVEGFGG